MLQHEKEKLLELFESKSRWCQHVEARDKRGHPVHYNDATAAAWDVVGGMCFLFGWERACQLFMQVGRHVAGVKPVHGLRDREMAAMASLVDFNDRHGTTHELVITSLRDLRVYSRKPSTVAGFSVDAP
jgi:hypothetical protein